MIERLMYSHYYQHYHYYYYYYYYFYYYLFISGPREPRRGLLQQPDRQLRAPRRQGRGQMAPRESHEPGLLSYVYVCVYIYIYIHIWQ